MPPFAVTWTVIPCLSHLVPFVGHLGITDSKGLQYDWVGQVHRSRTCSAFGRPSKIIELELNAEQQSLWDAAITEAENQYKSQGYSFISNNCHHFVAKILNSVGALNRTDWTCQNCVTRLRFKMKKF